VKDTILTLLSSDKAYPRSAPPQTKVTTPGGQLFFSKTLVITLTVIIDNKEADGAAFKIVMLPVIIDMAKFQPKTALGKLKAVITPTIPRGFHYSII
jgi:hypothetical protein